MCRKVVQENRFIKFTRKGVFLTEATTVVSALTSAFSTVASDALSAVQGILPIALPVLGAIIVVGIGIKIFKKVAGR